MNKTTLFELWAWRICAVLSIAGIPQQIWKDRAVDEIMPKLCPDCQAEIRKEHGNDHHV